MAQKFFDEGSMSRGVVLLGAGCTAAIRTTRVGCATAIATAEGPRVLASVFGIRVGIHWVVGIRWGRATVLSHDGFGWAVAILERMGVGVVGDLDGVGGRSGCSRVSGWLGGLLCGLLGGLLGAKVMGSGSTGFALDEGQFLMD